MFKNRVFPIIIVFVLILISCGNKTNSNSAQNNEVLTPFQNDTLVNNERDIIVGANRTDVYLPLLEGKRVGIVANQTSMMEVTERRPVDASTMGSAKTSYHLVDYLHNYNGITVQKVFAPEHGFRGTADAGEVVKDGIDTKTNLPIVSLYGKNKKPTSEQLADLDIVIFDIQDVGARFYTYISSLHYVMEACAEANVPMLILDRPNPNGALCRWPNFRTRTQEFCGHASHSCSSRNDYWRVCQND